MQASVEFANCLINDHSKLAAWLDLLFLRNLVPDLGELTSYLSSITIVETGHNGNFPTVWKTELSNIVWLASSLWMKDRVVELQHEPIGFWFDAKHPHWQLVEVGVLEERMNRLLHVNIISARQPPPEDYQHHKY